MDGKEIKRIRKSKGLTQAELAKMLGVARATVISYENGGEIPESKQDLLNNLLCGNAQMSNNDKEKCLLSDFSSFEIIEYISQNLAEFKKLSVFKLVVGLNELDELRELTKRLARENERLKNLTKGT